MKNKKLYLFLAILLIFSVRTADVYANGSVKYDPKTDGVETITSQIDIINGKIAGEKVGYYFQIPDSVYYRDYIIAERVIYVTSQPVLEKVNFYVRSDTRLENPEKPSLLLSLFAFKKLAWSNSLGLDEIFRTKDYVFAYEKRSASTFADYYNRIIFNDCYKNLCSLNILQQCLTLPRGQTIEFDHTVFYNGRPLQHKVVMDGSAYLLPLRDICEAMGYKVKWDEAASKVTIIGGSFSDSFIMKSLTKNVWGYPAKLIKGRTYISQLYFINVLGLDFEANTNVNVYLWTK